MNDKIKRFAKEFIALTSVFGLVFTNIQPVFAEGDEFDDDDWLNAQYLAMHPELRN